jgi:hypothetical protein
MTHRARSVGYLAIAALTASLAATGPAAFAAPTGGNVHVGDRTVGQLDPHSCAGECRHNLVIAPSGEVHVIGGMKQTSGSPPLGYYKRTASGKTFHGGAVGGTRHSFNAAIAANPSGSMVYAAVQTGCISPEGIYVIAKRASASKDRVATTHVACTGDRDPNFPDIADIAALRGGRVAVLVNGTFRDHGNDSIGLYVGKPGTAFTKVSLHSRTFPSGGIQDDFSDPEMALNPRSGDLDIAYSPFVADFSRGGVDIWTYRNNGTLHGPRQVVAPRDGRAVTVDSIAANNGQIWLGLERGKFGSQTGTIVHRTRHGHWGKPRFAHLTRRDGRSSRLMLAVVRATNALHVSYEDSVGTYERTLLANGHWGKAHLLPARQFVTDLVSTPSGGYLYSYTLHRLH